MEEYDNEKYKNLENVENLFKRIYRYDIITINLEIRGELNIKKKGFKKMMKKENKSFKDYYLYESIIIIFFVIMCIVNIILNANNIISLSTCILNNILTIICAIPIIIIDLVNDFEINKMYKQYDNDSKIPEYKNKTKILKILLVISVIIAIIESGNIIKDIYSKENVNMTEIENTLEITSNKGNII